MWRRARAIPEAPGSGSRGALPRWLPFAVFAPLALHFFETWPGGWDAAEYSWCVAAGYLPHSPYPLFVFLGRALAVFLPAPVALSLLSLGGALGALGGLWWWVRETAPCASASSEARWRATSATLLVAVSPLFVRHAATQEVYALQLGAVMGAAVLAASRVHRKHALAGAAFGAALAIHNGTLFLAPALAFLVVSRLGSRERRVAALGAWAGAAAAVLLAHYALLAWLLPAAPAERLAEWLLYLRGLPPGLDVAPLLQADHALAATAGLFERLTDASIATSRGPQATGATGLSYLVLAAALAGAVRLFSRNRSVAIFWLVWALPFLVYELALGWNLDYGVYLVFLLPPVAVFASEALWWPVAQLRRWPGAAPAALLVGFALLAAPAVSALVAQWPEPRADRLRHDSAATLAARWAAQSLPPDAVVVQPRSEWNANLLPLHAQRRHVARSGAGLRLFEGRGPWTPMRPDAYRTLSTAVLLELLDAGVPVFAFEADPLRASATPGLDPGAFRWDAIASVDLEAVARREAVRAPERFAGRQLPVYRASRAPLR